MVEIQTDSKRNLDCLEVKVGKNKHMIPLGKDVPLSFAMKMRRVRKLPEEERSDEFFDLLVGFILSYMGEDADALTIGDINKIVEAWHLGSEEDGVTEGE